MVRLEGVPHSEQEAEKEAGGYRGQIEAPVVMAGGVDRTDLDGPRGIARL